MFDVKKEEIQSGRTIAGTKTTVERHARRGVWLVEDEMFRVILSLLSIEMASGSYGPGARELISLV